MALSPRLTHHPARKSEVTSGAIDYALGLWSPLTVYLAGGRVEIDNNLVENAIRPTAIGKKNWLFVGDAEAGERSAIIYTIIESCRRRGLAPYAYLKADRIARRVVESIPHAPPHIPLGGGIS